MKVEKLSKEAIVKAIKFEKETLEELIVMYRDTYFVEDYKNQLKAINRLIEKIECLNEK